MAPSIFNMFRNILDALDPVYSCKLFLLPSSIKRTGWLSFLSLHGSVTDMDSCCSFVKAGRQRTGKSAGIFKRITTGGTETKRNLAEESGENQFVLPGPGTKFSIAG